MRLRTQLHPKASEGKSADFGSTVWQSQNARPGRKAIREIRCRRTQSIRLSLFGDDLRSRDASFLLTKDFSRDRREIGVGAWLRLNGDKTADWLIPLVQLDFFALAQLRFNFAKAIAQVAHSSPFHM